MGEERRTLITCDTEMCKLWFLKNLSPLVSHSPLGMNTFDLVVCLLPEISSHWDWALLFLECYKGILEFMVLHALAGSLRVITVYKPFQWNGRRNGYGQ